MKVQLLPVHRHVKRSYEGALPAELFREIHETREIVETMKQTVSDFPTDLRNQLTNRLDDVSKRLIGMEEGIDDVTKAFSAQEKRELASLYIGVILGALIGVIGNFFVSFWFQPPTPWNILGLVISIIMFLVVCMAFLFQARKYAKKVEET